MDWPGRALLVGLATIVVGGLVWLVMARSRNPWRTSEDRYERTVYASNYGLACVVFGGPPLILAGLAGLAGAGQFGAWVVAAVTLAAELPAARWLLDRYPVLRIAPEWTNEELWEVRVDALRTRRGCVFWAIVVLTAALAGLIILVVVAGSVT